MRWLHDPDADEGFVGAALSSTMWRFHRDNGSYTADKVIAVENQELEGWPLPGGAPGLITDLVVSMDDRFLDCSNWLRGDLRRYDISEPANRRLTGRLWLGGLLDKQSDAGRETARRAADAPALARSAEATELLAEALSRPDVWCLVAESHYGPVGHVALSPTTIVQPEPAPAGTVNLWQLFVRPTWQGRGVGRRLMRSAVSEAHRRGFARLRLWTPRGAARSRRFYEREDWTPTGNERDESPIGRPIVEYERASWQPHP